MKCSLYDGDVTYVSRMDNCTNNLPNDIKTKNLSIRDKRRRKLKERQIGNVR